MVKRTVPLVATAAHGIPGASTFSTTFQSAGSIPYTRRRSRDPIHSNAGLASQASACGVTAGESNRRSTRIIGSFILCNQHHFGTTDTQPQASWQIFLGCEFQLLP